MRKYIKNQILKYREFLIYNEVLKVILSDDKEYSIDEVKSMLENYFNPKKVETTTKKVTTKNKNEVND